MSDQRSSRLTILLAMLGLAAADAAQGAIFPTIDISDSRGLYEGVYFAIRNVNAPPLSPARIAQIEASELTTRQFYAANSGGAYDLRYTHILDVPLTLNADGTRIGDWIATAENYVRTNYGLEPENFHANIFDVSATTPDPGQGWSGLAWIPSNNFALQADVNSGWGQLVVDHELGHRIGAPHSGAWRLTNDANFTPFIYDYDQGAYVEYSASAHGAQAVPFGVHHDEYGNPFDVMGNISRGHFTVHEKLTNLNWLTPAQAPDLNQLGEGTYRIYAHDELDPIYSSRRDIYGVTETYDATSRYGLTYTRQGRRFDAGSGQFVPDSQQVTLEYRSGRDGLQIHLGDAVLDLDLEGGDDRNNLERELEVGRTVREIDFGVNFYASTGGGDDFLSHNPPAPTRPWDVLPQWFEFVVTGLGTDAVGSYIDLVVSREDYAIEAGVDADLNRDGVLNREDWLVFTSHTHTDLLGFAKTERYLRGDFNFDGKNNHSDFVYFRDAFNAAFGPAAFAQMLAIPEPSAMALACLLAATAGARRGRSLTMLRR